MVLGFITFVSESVTIVPKEYFPLSESFLKNLGRKLENCNFLKISVLKYENIKIWKAK